MVSSKCLPVLYLLITLPTSTPIAAAPVSRPAATRAMRGASSFSVAASRSSRLRARSAASTGLRQAISRSPGIVIGGDLGQVLLIEEAELERPVLGHQLLDRRGAQRGDPPVGIRPRRAVLVLVQRGDPGGGDHPPVADHDHLGQPELVPHHRDDLGERGRVAGVAGEYADRDRAALRVGEQPVLDLQPAFLAVPGVAAGGQRAPGALQPRGRQVEQRHPGRVRLRAQVAAGQPGLDLVLPVFQPVHRGVDVIGAGLGHAQVGAQRRVGPPGQGGQLGAGLDDPGDDQRQGQVPLPPGRAEQRGQAQLRRHGVRGGDVPVRHRPR